ncbi:MAG TPA: TraR/DksA C4-type zinc finger protein [Desulfopila sp.]|nr:TraR/DksA C4-type zinc finger protein [Desulfopila sp.]
MRDDIDRENLKRRLHRRRQELEEAREAQAKEGTPKELDQARVGRLSRMDAMQQQAMGQAAARLAEVELQRIHGALNRIASGEYGYCILCDESIAPKRLQFDPSLLTCIDCAQKAEEG